jgi:predicted MPP superfamily phosphohydrolase
MKIASLLLLFVLSIASLHAETRIAVLDFELKDLTMKPGIPEEVARTASIKPLLEKELQSADYHIINISPAAQQQANSGFGYLFDHNEVAAELGKTAGADYVLVGRLHKPSFLFAYLMGHLIRVKDGRLIGNYISESKGGDKKLTRKAVESLTVKIDADLDKRYTPPQPGQSH